jgi:adenylate cyclase
MSDRREFEPPAELRGAETFARPSATDVKAELERVLASRSFARAGRASDLLKFLVGETLAGMGARLKGYTIAVEVFGRPADFDPQTDPLVRVEAGRLRRRLLAYYSAEGSDDPVRIELPLGSYGAEFFYPPTDLGLEAMPGTAASKAARGREWKWRFVSAALLVAFVTALGVIGWQQRALLDAERGLDALGEPQRTEWPHVVVVPFENLSDEPRLGLLAAGMTEEVMVALGQRDVFVVASQASWYGADAGATALSSATGGYVLTGSIRGASEQARITVRLIEAESGTQIWSAGYDEPRAVYALSDFQEIVARDVAAVAVPYGPIFEAELARVRRSEHTPELRDCLVKYYDYRRRIDPATHEDVLLCFENVGARQPRVSDVWAGLAMLHLDGFGFNLARGGPASLAAARNATTNALALESDNFLANLALMRLQYFDGDPSFRHTLDRTLSMRPDSVEALSLGGILLVISNDSAGGLSLAERARALSRTPDGVFNLAYAINYLREGNCAAALTAALDIDLPRWIVTQEFIASTAALCGRDDLAREALARALELDPAFESQVLQHLARWHLDPVLEERLVAGLRAAGLRIEERSSQP